MQSSGPFLYILVDLSLTGGVLQSPENSPGYGLGLTCMPTNVYISIAINTILLHLQAWTYRGIYRDFKTLPHLTHVTVNDFCFADFGLGLAGAVVGGIYSGRGFGLDHSCSCCCGDYRGRDYCGHKELNETPSKLAKFLTPYII